MFATFRQFTLAVISLGIAGSLAVEAAENYSVDPVHSSVTFMIPHLGISYIHGRFNDLTGNFILDKDAPTKSSFSLTIRVESVDSNNKQRDTHLRSPDFFNDKQFPLLTFQSTSVKPVEGGYEVTGDLTLHGVKKPVTFTLKGGKTADFPKGMQRTGFTTTLTLKRSDFGVGDPKFKDALGDEVHIAIGLEGVKQ